MKARQCALAEEILEATRSDGLTDEMKQHLSTCRSCSEAATLDALFQVESRSIPELDRLPDPGRIWLHARQQRLLHAAERATKPIRAAEKIALAAGAAGLAVGSAMSWPMVRAWFGQTASILSNVGGNTDSVLPANPVPLIAGTVLFLVLFGLYSELVEG